MSDPTLSRPIRFGLFEVDVHTGELHKHGLKLKLTGQPFDVLAMLLEHPGEIVTREELQKKLWPADTFVDFEHGLNTAVKKLREALGDSADNPRFVETLARRGYRFIYAVEPVAAMSPSPSEAAVREPPLARKRPGAAALGIALAALVMLIGAVAWHFLRYGSQVSLRPLTVTPLTSYPGVENGASFSPEGNQIAFHWNGEHRDNWDIYVKVIGTEKPLRLTTNPADDLWPAWSPDGRQIAFLRKMETACAIFTIPPLGGAERKLIDLKWESNSQVLVPGRLSWSPDGQWLAVSHKVSEQKPFRILLLSLETLETKTLTSPPEDIVGDILLAFSPDGKAVAFARRVNANVATLMIQPVSGGEPRSLTSEAGLGFDVKGLTWTSDGKELLFSGERLGRGQPGNRLWRISASGGSPEQVPGVGDNVGSPTASHQGDRLALTRTLQADRSGIWRLPGPKSGSPGSPPQPFIPNS